MHALVRVERGLQPALDLRVGGKRVPVPEGVVVQPVKIGLAVVEQVIGQIEQRAEQGIADLQPQVPVEDADAAGNVRKHLFEQQVVLAQLLARLDLLADVQRRSHVAVGPAGVRCERSRLDLQMPHHPVGTPDPVPGLETDASCDGRLPFGEHPVAVVGVDHLAPSGA